MAKWASVKEVAEHLSMTELAIRQQIARGSGIGPLFKRVSERTLRADLDEVDSWVKGEKS